MNEERQRRLGRAWAIAQIALLGVFLFLIPVRPGADWPAPIRLLAIPLASAAVLLGIRGLLGIGRRLTPSPMPPKETRLVCEGIYARVRHPMYGGVILLFISWALFRESLFHLLAIPLLLVFFLAKSKWEEARLIERFPEYDEYRRRTKRFIPGLF